MIKKYFAITLISASMLAMGCSSDDDGDDNATDGGTNMMTDNGDMTNGGDMTPAYMPGPEVVLNVVEAAIAREDLSTLVTAITTANLGDALSDADARFTVFAPNNSAFEAFDMANPESQVGTLTAEQLTPVLQTHVVAQALTGDAVVAANGTALDTLLAGTQIPVVVTGEGADASIMVGGATVVETIEATNGLIHIVNAVVTGQDAPMEMMGGEDMGGENMGGGTDYGTTLMGSISGQANLSMITAALVASGLDSALANPMDSFTMFAPTDEALTTAGVTAADLTAMALQAHIVGGLSVTSDTLTDGQVVSLIRGMQTVAIADGVVSIGGANVVTADIAGDNGTLHIINGVLTAQ